ncbi:hypothetical protein V492_03744 [Pseudogymnoascus sp. VKM F-4246]|nr:hypothetical protein V492_03744 [Pseudogymnoascus sp. VKM F-4246]
MRASNLYRSVSLLAIALTPAINAAYDAISKPLLGAEGVSNSESGNITTGDVLHESSNRTSYRIHGPNQIAVVYTEYDCPRLHGAHQLYSPGNDTDEPELLQIEHCAARCMNLPEGNRGQSIELSLAGPIIIGETPDRPYARLYELSDCRGVGKEAMMRRSRKWTCTNVENGFWHPAREGGFGSFMVWEGCRYLESEEQKQEKLRQWRLNKGREKSKADMEKIRWESNEKERKIQKQENKMERKLEKQTQKEGLKQWEREQKEKKKQDKQDKKQEEREDIVREKERKAAWAARKAQRKQDMKKQFEEWRQDRIMELEEDGAKQRAERKALRQKEREDRQAELLEMERQWEQDRRDKIVEDDKEWEEQLANEAIESARDEEEEDMLEATELVVVEEEEKIPDATEILEEEEEILEADGISTEEEDWPE